MCIRDSYVWHGGFSAVVKTDKIQFVLMFGGFFTLLIIAWIQVGSPVILAKNLPELHMEPLGGNSFQYILATH